MELEIFVAITCILIVNVLSIWKIVDSVKNMEEMIKKMYKRSFNNDNIIASTNTDSKEEQAKQKEKIFSFVDALFLDNATSADIKKQIVDAMNTKEPDYYAKYVDGKVIDTFLSTVIAKKIDSNFVEWLMKSPDAKYIFQYDCVTKDPESREYKIVVLNDYTYSNILNEMLSDDNKWDIYVDDFDPEFELNELLPKLPKNCDIAVEGVQTEAVISNSDPETMFSANEKAEETVKA